MYLLVSTKQCVCVGELSAISPLLMVGFVLSNGESTCRSMVCWSCDPLSISHHHQCLTPEHLPVYSLLVLWSRWSFVNQSSPPGSDSAAPDSNLLSSRQSQSRHSKLSRGLHKEGWNGAVRVGLSWKTQDEWCFCKWKQWQEHFLVCLVFFSFLLLFPFFPSWSMLFLVFFGRLSMLLPWAITQINVTFVNHY